MREEIKVHTLKKPGRKILYMRYVDPLTGKQVTRSARTTKQRDADREAAKWEADLREGRYKAPSKVTWAEFRLRYEAEVLPGLADSTFSKVHSAFSSVEQLTPVDRLSSLTAERISKWQQQLRDKQLSETTIKSYSAHLKAALRWGVDVGMIHAAPKIRMPSRAKSSTLMKGRPITAEEFERMLAKVAAVVGEDRSESWKRLLRGLWWSGLRLGEALALHWTDGGMMVDLFGRRPMLRIAADSEKGHKDRLLPMAPEFSEMLSAVPAVDRTGFVFNPAKAQSLERYRDVREVGRIITECGSKAKVKVSDETRLGKSGVKYASAHDLRRAFGARWATRIMPPDLQLLMRHETIETTMKFYVGQNADQTADRLWNALGDTSGDTLPRSASETASEHSDAQ